MVKKRNLVNYLIHFIAQMRFIAELFMLYYSLLLLKNLDLLDCLDYW